MLTIMIKKKNGAYYIHSKLSDIFTDMHAAKTQFIDGLGINTDHKPYLLSQ